ncbi:unnamed protein product [Cladocopium goreaui]|uniref:Uncharacterized protein n=1 Tax=Cladocopium goreaui TaxID=2562237 RepID=A0A9P1DFV8_9DINO|nr:unnamed protein product [Cladocopium goreaui]
MGEAVPPSDGAAGDLASMRSRTEAAATPRLSSTAISTIIDLTGMSFSRKRKNQAGQDGKGRKRLTGDPVEARQEEAHQRQRMQSMQPKKPCGHMDLKAKNEDLKLEALLQQCALQLEALIKQWAVQLEALVQRRAVKLEAPVQQRALAWHQRRLKRVFRDRGG